MRSRNSSQRSGPVVHRAGQPEAEVDQVALARHVALVHRADLRHGDVGLVDDEEEVLGEVVEQAVRRRSPGPAVDVQAVVLDAGAGPDLAHHLDVVGGAHPQPLGLEQLALLLERGELVLELELDAADRPLHPLGTGDVVRRREDVHLRLLAHDLAGQRVQRVDALDLVAEELDPDRELLVDRDDLDGVAPHPERAAGEREVVAGVLHLHEPAQQLVALDLEADPEPGHPVDVLLRGAEAVDAGHRGDDDDVAAGEQRVGGAVPQPLDLVVDRGVLLDVGVGLGDVRLGLVVVVVARRSTRRRCCGSSSRNSLASWAARVLLGAMTSVGRCTCSISHAVVADLPVPVAPSRTTSCSPALIRAARSAIAAGWSPLGSKSETTPKGATVRWRSVVGRMGQP